MTIKNTLQSLAQAGENRSKMGRLREVLPDIEAAKNAGVSNAKIVEALNAKHDLQLNVKTFEMMLYRLRKESSERLSERRQVAEPVKTQQPVSTASKPVEAPKKEPESVSNNDEVEAYISPKKRREQNANRFITNEDNPLLKRNKD